MRGRTSVFFLLGVLVAGCATETDTRFVRDGVNYGTVPSTPGVFRGRWWSYYERGSNLLSGEFYEAAAADFEEALQGRSRDSWRARTYGLHFVEYFPNRELGVALYHLGRLDEAQQNLESSLEQMDTARGHYFLDQVKRMQIARGAISDDAKPTLVARLMPKQTLAEAIPVAPPAPVEEKEPVAEAPAPEPAKPAPAPAKPAEAPRPIEKPKPVEKPVAPPVRDGRIIVASRELTVQVEATDDVGVAEVSVNGQALNQRGSDTTVAKEEDILLEEGTHEIEVASKDLADKEVVEKVTVTVDMTGPTIGVFSPIEPTVTDHGTVILEGATVDKNGVVSVGVGQRILAESPGDPRLDFDSELPLGDGENTFVLAARDIAGNETRSAIKVFKGDPDSLAAKLWLLEQKFPERLKLAMAEPALVDILLSATPEPGNEIRLKSPDLEKPYRNNRNLHLSVDVVTQTKLASLTINGEPFEDLTGAPKESVSKSISLNPNDISDEGTKVAVAIRAEDEAGTVFEKQVEVMVQPVTLDTKESKMPLAVLAFTGQDVEAALSERLRLDTEGSLMKRKRFRIQDRTQLEAVLTEQQLAGSPLANQTDALRLGQLVNVHTFLVADLFKRDQAGVEIKARAIDPETTDIIERVDVFIDDVNSQEAVKKGCDALAEAVGALFPRISGEVLRERTSGDTQEILVNWTPEDGVREGTRVIVVYKEPDEIDESTGEVVWPGDIYPVGRAQIVGFTSMGARARSIAFDKEDTKFEQGMPAISM